MGNRVNLVYGAWLHSIAPAHAVPVRWHGLRLSVRSTAGESDAEQPLSSVACEVELVPRPEQPVRAAPVDGTVCDPPLWVGHPAVDRKGSPVQLPVPSHRVIQPTVLVEHAGHPLQISPQPRIASAIGLSGPGVDV